MDLGPVDTINLLIGQPFRLAEQDPSKLKEIVDFIVDKTNQCETQLSSMYEEMNAGANAWRMIPKRSGSKRPVGLFNSVSGETNRAVNTLASLYFRMLTAGDPYYEAVAEGVDQFGRELSEVDLYAAEIVTGKQLRVSQYKRKLLKVLRSLCAFGTVFVDQPYISRPDIEYTDFNLRSLLLTYFDPFVFDMSMSDFVAFSDFPTIYKMRELYHSDEGTWDRDLIEKAIQKVEDQFSLPDPKNSALSRVYQRKERAGYNSSTVKATQLLTYHGRLNTENEVLQKIWELEGRQDDINATDWTVSIYGDQIVRLHPTPYGTWKHHVKVASINEFEIEPVGYGVSKIGKKPQRELDLTQSRMNDILMFALYSMWKVGKYSGFNPNNFTIKPWGIVELEDINQLERLSSDPQAIQQALAMQAILKEDFRTTTGATTNLQAQITNATASEAALAQTEAIRGGSVVAEIIAESLVREHIEDNYINNLDMLDKEIFVTITGQQKPYAASFNRHTLPRGIGFQVKITTDKDFRPERQKNLLQGLQLATSIRNMIPESLNVIRPLFEEWFRSVGLNPRLLNQPIPLADQIINFMRKQQMSGGGPKVGNEVAGEKADEGSGYPNVTDTPVGQVPSSPGGSETMGAP